MRSILDIKQGELTTKQIVTLIILIISFVIVLYFIFLLNPKESSEEQICHNSVTLRGNSLLGGQTIPLNCKTSYVYVTASSTRSNSRMGNPSRVVEVKTEEDVYEFLANEMYDCWWMFGQGKIDYLGESDLFKTPYCSICSQIVFDESVKKIPGFESGKINKDVFYKTYLTKKIPGQEITYSKYFFGVDDPTKLLTTVEQLDENDKQTGVFVPINSFGQINLDKTQILIMSIKSKVSKLAWGGLIAALSIPFLMVGVFLAPVGIVIGTIIVIGGATGGGAAGAIIVAPLVQGDSGNQYTSPTFIEPDSTEFKSLQCDKIKSLS